MSRPPFAVLGLGNELFTDEGVGVEAARRVGELGIMDVEIVDGGTLGLGLLPEIEGRRGVLVLDAVVSDGAEPGTLLHLERADLLRPHLLLYSAHQIGVQEALAAAELAGGAPEFVAGVGLVPFSLDTGYGLTAAAEARLPALVGAAVGILASWGVEVPAHA